MMDCQPVIFVESFKVDVESEAYRRLPLVNEELVDV